jgi:hypothetical protein
LYLGLALGVVAASVAIYSYSASRRSRPNPPTEQAA